MSSRIKLTLQYKGTNYCGWQVQPNGLAIQEVLEKTLSKILQTKIKVTGSGRTDSGVHALEQVCHFDLPLEIEKRFSQGDLNLQKILCGLNSLLPNDIAAAHIKTVSFDFHAQKSVRKKIYEYTIFNSMIPSPFLNDYAWRVPYPLNVKKMRQAARVLKGEHDFKAFCASDSTVQTTTRRIYKLSIKKMSKKGVLQYAPTIRGNQNVIIIHVEGSGFLKHMVRNLVGTLVDVGRGKKTVSDVKKILKSRDRRQAGRTAPAQGLCLKRVVYAKNW